MKNTIQIYVNEGHQVEVRLDGKHNTVWLSQAQMVDLFERDQSVISRHVRNVFKEEELEGESNMQKMHIAHSDKLVAFYSLDVIISVGYRVKSPQDIRFRQWATQRLVAHFCLSISCIVMVACWMRPVMRSSTILAWRH